MRFTRLNKTKIIGRDSIRIEIRYFANGEMESHVTCKEEGKWRTVTMTFCEDIPTWDHLQKCGYIGRGDKCFEPPSPVNAVIKHMQYVVHCFGVMASRKRKIALPSPQ